MLRQTLLYLSQSRGAQRLVMGTPFSRRMAQRFVAGESLDSAIEAARGLNAAGLEVTLDYLGESVTSRPEAEAATEMAVAILERIRKEGVRSNISVKPSAFGLDIDEEFCTLNIERVLGRARDLGDGEREIFVRLDMESSEYTERTVRMVDRLWADGFRNVGTVLQSYLHRTPSDLAHLIEQGSRVRLVKGAYQEPPTVAFQEKAEVDRKYLEEMRMLLDRGNFPAIATHDEEMIEATRRYAEKRSIPRDRFEFQLLYGVRRDLQTQLRQEGYGVRVYVPFGGSWYPYLMRRLAERPANLMFIVGSVLKEAPAGRALSRAAALGAGAVAGTAATRAYKKRRD